MHRSTISTSVSSIRIALPNRAHVVQPGTWICELNAP